MQEMRQKDEDEADSLLRDPLETAAVFTPGNGTVSSVPLGRFPWHFPEASPFELPSNTTGTSEVGSTRAGKLHDLQETLDLRLALLLASQSDDVDS